MSRARRACVNARTREAATQHAARTGDCDDAPYAVVAEGCGAARRARKQRSRHHGNEKLRRSSRCVPARQPRPRRRQRQLQARRRLQRRLLLRDGASSAAAWRDRLHREFQQLICAAGQHSAAGGSALQLLQTGMRAGCISHSGCSTAPESLSGVLRADVYDSQQRFARLKRDVKIKGRAVHHVQQRSNSIGEADVGGSATSDARKCTAGCGRQSADQGRS